MLSFALMTQKCALAAFCCFSVYMFITSLQSLPHLHATYLQPHNDPTDNDPTDNFHVQVANGITKELRWLLQHPPELGDFGAMGDRIARFSVLAEAAMNEPLVDRQPLMSLLRDYFPWWQPLPTTYMPWDSHSVESVGETGLVICAGQPNLIFAIHLIRSLRNVLNSTLPIQIAYAGDDDLSFHDRRVLIDLGPNIETLNLLDYFDDDMSGLVGGSWAMKPFAMLASRFKETIMVDADAVFLRAPDGVFNDEPGLRETGTLFWHDREWMIGKRERHAWVHKIMEGREPSPMLSQSLFWTHNAYQEMDSGVVCMDKGRPNVFMSLLFASWMNTDQVRKEVTYKHTHGELSALSNTAARSKLTVYLGDKETFWLASELSSSNYSFMPRYASTIGALIPIYPKPASAEEPLIPFRSPLLNPSPPSHVTKPFEHDPSDLKPRLGSTRELQHHRIPSAHPPHPGPMQICSTHMLHLDHLGRPFWFNGSLRKNKSKKDSVQMETFTHVILASANVTEGSWKYSPEPPCLRKGQILALEGAERTVIEAVVSEARRADMDVLGKNDLEEGTKE